MYGKELLMMGRKAARNMYSRNNNKIGIQCICWFYSQGICYDAQSYDSKMTAIFVPVSSAFLSTELTCTCQTYVRA